MTQPGAYPKRLQHAGQREPNRPSGAAANRSASGSSVKGPSPAGPAGLGTGRARPRVPETVTEEVQWQLQAQQKLLGKIFGMMFPPGVWVPQLPRAVPGPRLG